MEALYEYGDFDVEFMNYIIEDAITIFYTFFFFSGVILVPKTAFSHRNFSEEMKGMLLVYVFFISPPYIKGKTYIWYHKFSKAISFHLHVI